MNKDKHIIWSNLNLDFNNWKADLIEQYPKKSESELIDLMYEINSDYLNDERVNLDIHLNENILIIADIGRWNGRFSGYKEISSGNIKDCLYTECDYAEWFVDKNADFRCDAHHHDGVNHYLYRVYKDGVTSSQIDNLKNKLYDGTATRADITRITNKIGNEIAKVYGWDLNNKKEIQKER